MDTECHHCAGEGDLAATLDVDGEKQVIDSPFCEPCLDALSGREGITVESRSPFVSLV